MHSIWWYCTSILLKIVTLKIMLIKLADEFLSSFLPLKVGAELLTTGG